MLTNDEAIEAGAKALFSRGWSGTTAWQDLNPEVQEAYRDDARLVLHAVRQASQEADPG